MKSDDGTDRGFGVIASALCAAVASAIYTVGVVAGCRATACDNSEPSSMLFMLLLPIGALMAGPIVAVRVARMSVSGLWLAVVCSLLAVAAAVLSVRETLPADVGEAFAFTAALGLGVSLFLAPLAGVITAKRFKRRVRASGLLQSDSP